ncbi:MAG: hypothetical protein L0I76_24945 [Pseudonocardia sp.]|nr:hypothetical protein [Pseudonocardia sp.]
MISAPPEPLATLREAPTLPAFRNGQTLLVWCGWCRHWHRHGGHDANADGHRTAHCFRPGSPYRPAGYVLVEVGAMTPEVRAAHRRLRPSVAECCR